MASSLYLENYLDSLEPLPGELRRNFTLMHDLDVKNKSMLRDVDAASDEYLRKARELSSSQRGAEMEKIQKMFKMAKEHGDDKVSIAVQTYEMVDKHIRRLDSDLAKFEAEMREQGGRLSQTETEDEAGSVSSSLQKKKKGRKVTAKEAAAANKKTGKRKGGKDDKEDKKSKKGQGRANKQDREGAALSAVATAAALLPGGMPQEIIDMPVDPNEPTYCLCQQVSYGEMIGCDNADCPIEWFHFGCMALTNKPKGKWYCPKCAPQFKKKK